MRFIALVVALFVLGTGVVDAGQTKIKNYNSARDTYFDKQLYPNGGWTFYCPTKWTSRAGLNV